VIGDVDGDGDGPQIVAVNDHVNDHEKSIRIRALLYRCGRSARCADRRLAAGVPSCYARIMSERRAEPVRIEVDRNVLGGPLAMCSLRTMTGFFRTGCCETGPEDRGRHVVCAQMTEEFLAFSVSRGNDMVTPQPDHGFPGLRPGDRWCLCAARWKEALDAGLAPPVILAATHEAALEVVALEELLVHALDRAQA